MACLRHGVIRCDLVGNRLSVSDIVIGVARGIEQFNYDAANRLTQMTGPNGTSNYNYDQRGQMLGSDHSTQTDELYGYDANGNRTNAGYQTGSNNQLLSDGVYTYTYDQEGNRSSRTNISTGEITDYTWDYRNRLTGFTVRAGSGGAFTRQADYTYDAYDRRIAKVVDQDGAGSQAATTERFAYDGQHISLVFDGQGNQTERYLHGPQVDQVLAVEKGGQTQWMLADHQGTVRQIVDESGALLNQINYDSFGNISNQTNPAVTFRFGYTGREWDGETGKYYYRARYFDPRAGQFISQDPIGFEGGDANLYRYVGNSPTNFTDPTGNRAFRNPYEPEKLEEEDKDKTEEESESVETEDGFPAISLPRPRSAPAMDFGPEILDIIGANQQTPAIPMSTEVMRLGGVRADITGLALGGMAPAGAKTPGSMEAAIGGALAAAMSTKGAERTAAAPQTQQTGLFDNRPVDMGQSLLDAIRGRKPNEDGIGKRDPNRNDGIGIPIFDRPIWYPKQFTNVAVPISARLPEGSVYIRPINQPSFSMPNLNPSDPNSIWRRPPFGAGGCGTGGGNGGGGGNGRGRGNGGGNGGGWDWPNFNPTDPNSLFNLNNLLNPVPALIRAGTEALARTIAPNQTAVNVAYNTDQFSAGFGSSVSLGGTDLARGAIYGDLARRNQQGGWNVFGQVVGGVASLALGYGAPARLVQGLTWAQRLAQVHTVASAGVGSYRSTRNFAEGRGTAWDALAYTPLAGPLGRVTRSGLNRIPANVQYYSFGLTRNADIIGQIPVASLGHVGFSFNNGKKIYDFIPDTNLQGRELFNALRRRETFPGLLSDGTTTFNRARDLGLNVKVETRTIGLGDWLGARANARFEQTIGTLGGKQFRLPPKTGSAPVGCYNCATYPTSIGLPTPYPSGFLNGAK